MRKMLTSLHSNLLRLSHNICTIALLDQSRDQRRGWRRANFWEDAR